MPLPIVAWVTSVIAGPPPTGSSSRWIRPVNTPQCCPIGKVVEVTGVSDHPAAASCTGNVGVDDVPVPTHDCRLEFAVTRLVAVGP